MTHSIARPNKLMDAAELVEWVIENYSDVWAEYEFGCRAEYSDFWEWLDRAYCDILFEFKEWFKSQE